MSVTVTADQLQLLLNAAVGFTAVSTSARTALQSIRLERLGDHLAAVSTDQYRMGVTRVPAQFDGGGDWQATVVKHELRPLRAALKTVAKKAPVTFKLTDDGLSVAVEGFSLVLPLADVEFPSWRTLMVGGDYSTGVPTQVSSYLLSTFRGAVRNTTDAAVVACSSSPTRPIRITVGDYFCGLLMPQKPTPEAAADSRWLEEALKK